MEVGEGQELEVLPKKKIEEEQQEEILTKAIKTPKRPKVSKMKSSLSPENEKYLANITGQAVCPD